MPPSTVDGVRRHGALDAQPATLLAAVANADLVGVAVVVDRRAEELRDDHAAGDDNDAEHGDRRPVAALLVGALRRLRAATGPSVSVTVTVTEPGLDLVGQLGRRPASATDDVGGVGDHGAERHGVGGEDEPGVFHQRAPRPGGCAPRPHRRPAQAVCSWRSLGRGGCRRLLLPLSDRQVEAGLVEQVLGGERRADGGSPARRTAS